MRVLGIDPGTFNTGVGIVEKEGSRLKPVFFETIKVSANIPLSKRLKRIYDSLTEVLKIYRPDAVSLESIFFSKNFKTAVKIGEARSVAILAATNFDVEIIEYPPARVKEAVTGNGRASKIQMQNMVKVLLNLKELPEVDTADALALAYCHLNSKKIGKEKEAA